MGTRRRRVGSGLPQFRQAMVGSPLGHTDVTVDRGLPARGAARPGLRRARSPGRADRAGAAEAGDPPLRGPVLGLVPERTSTATPGTRAWSGAAPHARAFGCAGRRVDRPHRARDWIRTLAARVPFAPGSARSIRPGSRSTRWRIVDAADVIAFRARAETRYATRYPSASAGFARRARTRWSRPPSWCGTARAPGGRRSSARRCSRLRPAAGWLPGTRRADGRSTGAGSSRSAISRSRATTSGWSR